MISQAISRPRLWPRSRACRCAVGTEMTTSPKKRGGDRSLFFFTLIGFECASENANTSVG